MEGKSFLTLVHSEEFEIAYKESQVVHYLVLNEVLITTENPLENQLPKDIPLLFEEFRDIMPEELLPELSLMRDIITILILLLELACESTTLPDESKRERDFTRES